MQSSIGGAISSSKTSAQKNKWCVKWKGIYKIGEHFEKYTSDKRLMYKWYKELIAAAALIRFNRVQLCDPRDGSPPGSPVPGILQARTLEWVAVSFSNAWKCKVKVKSLSHVRLFANPMDCSLPGSSTHEIFQARVLEWVAIAFSEGTHYSIAKKKNKIFF